MNIMNLSFALLFLFGQNINSTQSSVKPQSDSITVNKKEYVDLQRIQIMREMQDEIDNWIQKRFWILAALIAVIGFFGIRSLVREMITNELKTATQATADAKAAADQAKDVTKEVRLSADKFTEHVDRLNRDATVLDEKLKTLDQRISAESAHAIAASELKINELSSQLKELSSAVQQLAAESHDSRKVLQDYQIKLEHLTSEANELETKFEENSKFSVVVVHHLGGPNEPIAKEIVAMLIPLGFKASTGHWAPDVPPRSEIKVDYSQGADKKGKEIFDLIKIMPSIIEKYSGGVQLKQRIKPSEKDEIRVFL